MVGKNKMSGERKKLKSLSNDKIFDIFSIVIMCGVSLIVLYPLYFIIIASFSDPDAVNTGSVVFFPKGFTIAGYKRLFTDARIWIGYRNTIYYTVFGTSLNVSLTLMSGYALSRKDFIGRNIIMALFVFTMYFNGGLIPTYILVKNLGLLNTPLVMILVGAVSVWHIIITRTYFQAAIPQELLDAASIDGCSNGRFFFQIVLPLSNAIIAVLVVYFAVHHWNSFFNALIFLSERKLYPLQLILRQILIQSQMIVEDLTNIADGAIQERYAELIKYGVIIVSSVPVLILYPFVQKHFVKGVMIGSVKG